MRTAAFPPVYVEFFTFDPSCFSVERVSSDEKFTSRKYGLMSKKNPKGITLVVKINKGGGNI